MSVVRVKRAAWIPTPLKWSAAVCLALILTSALGGMLGLAKGQAPPSAQGDQTGVRESRATSLSTTGRIEDLQAWLRTHPADGEAFSQLGDSYLQRARETADPSYYTRAEAALTKALELDPNDFEAMISLGALALSRHQFPDALAWAERARTINPYRSAIDGIVGDAQLELGNYDAAFDAYQAMMDRRPDLASYSRVSYARELLGDTDGAITAMRQAVKLGPRAGENTAWSRVQLGNLYASYTGDLAAAEAEYRRALADSPGYVHAQAGLARLSAARGEYGAAATIYESLVTVMPLPEFIIALGDLYTVDGRSDEAARQYALVRAVQELNRVNGVDADLELTLFDADHNFDLTEALERARAQFAHRPSIKTGDALAWTLFKSGDSGAAQSASEQALRLGTRDPQLAFHAGMIAHQRGDASGAREHLRRAVSVSPGHSILHVMQARQILAELNKDR